MVSSASIRGLIVLIAVIAWGGDAAAQLESIEVGGYLRARYRWYDNVYAYPASTPGEIRIPDGYLPGRAIGPWGTRTRYAWDEDSSRLEYADQLVRLNVTATMANGVSTFMEINQSHRWGNKEFRSDYITGLDTYVASPTPITLQQAYVDIDAPYGMPLNLRIGRQNITFGRKWLVSSESGVLDRSFDGIRATWRGDTWSLDLFHTYLSENSPIEADGDVTFSGIYGNWTVNPHVTLQPYWLWIRDPISRNDTIFTAAVEWLEDVFGLDDYDPTNLHTIGLRAFGSYSSSDFDVEAAYQLGEADAIGQKFSAFGRYGDNKAEFDSWGFEATLGYTFDTRFSPRVYATAAYFGGEDNRDVTLFDWLNPFDRPEASVSFNRMFSDTAYLYPWDNNKNMTNFRRMAIGVELQLTDAVTADINIGRYWVNEPFDLPLSMHVAGYRVPIAPSLSFLTEEASDDMGYGLDFMMRYAYSKDIAFRIGYQHIFAGDALQDGNFQDRNGLEFNGGSGGDDGTYLYSDVVVKF